MLAERAARLVLAISALSSCSSRPAAPPPGPGIPLEMAEARAARLSDLRYALALTVPRAATAPIRGTNRLTFTLANAADPLPIDFATSREHVERVEANGQNVPVEWVNGHILVPASALTAGQNSITIAFSAGDASLNRNADFLYALFVPARAHLAIPVFDQPNLKARWSLTLTAPVGWAVVANGAETRRRDIPATDRSEAAVEVTFAETQPLPTYLFSFVVGEFKMETATVDGRTFRMFHRETEAAKVARNRAAIFDLHARAIAYMEEYTALPYAFGKFDFVLIPAFQFNGMEHAGKILYRADSMMLDASATLDQLLGRASTIAHETAHMWFGDLVTMKWFNDVWMKEVFANFMAAKIVNPSFPNVNHELRFLLAHYPGAYDVDRTQGTTAIRQPLANLNEAGSLYGAIIYLKAPIVMRHLERLMGGQNFRDGLREYLKKYAFSNATWPELIAILDARTSYDLAAWSRVWVEERGRPTVTTTLETSGGSMTTLHFTQRDDTWKRLLVWPQELRVTLGYDGSRLDTVAVTVTEATVDVPVAAARPAPRFVLPNGGGWGYGRFVLDPASLEYLTSRLPEIRDPLTRGAAWVTLWESMLDGAPQAARFVDLTLSALPRETDEQLTQQVLDYLRDAWWKFLTPVEREPRQAALEALLRRGLASASTASEKSAWFGALREVAMGRDTLVWLKRVWAKQEQVPGLPLAEADYSGLAQDLALREVEGWKAMLETELQRIENPDWKARFAFVMPSLSSDAAEREHWFAQLAKVENRRREPWVLDGLGHLHHPLRAAQSAHLVKPTLELLREVQRTGDIFFPTRWMNVTLSDHTAPEVAATVRSFLDTLPADYPERLRNTILQAADGLFRVQSVRSVIKG